MSRLNDITSTKNKKGVANLLVIVFVVILFVLAIVATYIWQHTQIDKLNQQVGDLNQQLKTTRTDNKQTTPPNTNPAQTNYTSLKSTTVNIYSPRGDEKIASPLAVIGEVPGSWSFEASFPIKILNSNGKVVAQTSAQILGNWMTDRLVPFSAKLPWTTQETGTGTLVLVKDNPSGIASNNDSVSVPVKF